MSHLQSAIEQFVTRQFPETEKLVGWEETRGGCIDRSQIARFANGQAFFVKRTPIGQIDRLRQEQTGLLALQAIDVIATPRVIGLEAMGEHACLILTAVDVDPTRPAAEFFVEFGRQLARLHRQTVGIQYGFESDNYIGATPQPNRVADDWVDFFRQQRLGFQLRIAQEQGRGGTRLQRLGSQLMDQLETRLRRSERHPSLIHGDLWSGNWLRRVDGQPVLIDPAVYWADREAEFGMIELFGGLPEPFYVGYNENYPLEAGWEERVRVYSLYHLLNHLNLFGTSYLSDCLNRLEDLVRRP